MPRKRVTAIPEAADANRSETNELQDQCLRCLKAMLSYDPSGVAVYDSDKKLRFCNDAFGELYGIDSEALLDSLSKDEMNAMLKMTGGADKQTAHVVDPDEAKTNAPRSQIKVLPDGRMLQIRAIPAGQGNRVYRHTVIGKLDETAEANELLSLRTLIDQLEDYLWVKDVESRFVVANRSIARDNGFSDPSEILGLTDYDIHSPEIAARFREDELRVIETGVSLLDSEDEVDGGNRWFSTSKIPLCDDKGEIIGIVGVSRDITSRKKEEKLHKRTLELEAESRQLAKTLERERQINEQQRQFFSMASHEFRTPLTVIDGAAQRLLRKKGLIEEEELIEKAEKIRRSVSRMIDLMDGFLSFGKLEAGSLILDPRECHIQELLANRCRMQQEISRNHRISFDKGNLPETIIADTHALEGVISNLLSNAVKYSPDAPEISVRGWSEDDKIKIAVSDNGLGIDEDDVPKLFSRYFRARTSTGIPGTGIGLNLVAQVVELHGGSVGVESRKGEGSTFTVTLPRGSHE